MAVSYRYDCSSTGGSGFVADMISGTPGSQNYDDQGVASVSGASGSATATVYPQDVGSSYYFEISSDCAWSIAVANA